MFRFSVLAVIVFSSCLAVGESARILGLFPSLSKSHLIINMAIIQPMIERGHDVTIVTSLPLDNPNEKFHHVKLDLPPPTREFRSGLTKSSRGPFYFINLAQRVLKQVLLDANATLNEPKMRKLMDEESFDLVVLGYFFSDFLIGVAGHFKCPLVVSWTGLPTRGLSNMVGNPAEVFYVPQTITGLQQPMGFTARVKNFLFSIMEIGVFSVMNYKMATQYEIHFPSDKYPSFDEMRKNVSLLLVNGYLNQGPIRPNVPGLIQYGGIQVKPKPDPLPEDIRKHLDSASVHGAIYFCLGSNLQSDEINPEMISIIYKVLSSLKQKVIWKWDGEKSPGNSPNILFKKWLPQDDILAHPNTKLFITHGGQGGITEAQYHGVPMVGIPFFADQFSNMNAIESADFGLSLDKEKITEELFRETVMEVLQNPKYKESVTRFSIIFRDRPMSARDNVAFWLEYVIRHRGAKHLQSPAVHMNAVQYYGIDVIAFLLGTLYVLCKVTAFVFKKTICKLFKGKCKKNKVSNKEKRQ